MTERKLMKALKELCYGGHNANVVSTNKVANWIVTLLYESAHAYEDSGHNADWLFDKANKLHDMLADEGYYDDIRKKRS